jgi:hypothetical protein
MIVSGHAYPVCRRVIRAQSCLLRRAGFVALALAAVGLVWVDPGSLCVLPALVLWLLLRLRRYPGERRLVTLWRVRGERRAWLTASVPCVARDGIVTPRGGLLLACALAVRPPPPALHATA